MTTSRRRRRARRNSSPHAASSGVDESATEGRRGRRVIDQAAAANKSGNGCQHSSLSAWWVAGIATRHAGGRDFTRRVTVAKYRKRYFRSSETERHASLTRRSTATVTQCRPRRFTGRGGYRGDILPRHCNKSHIVKQRVPLLSTHSQFCRITILSSTQLA